jgi:hypothetical protein
LWVHRCLRWPGVHVKWTMQHASDARLKWMEEHVPTLAESELADLLLPGSEGIRKQNGSEHVKFRNGSMQTLMSTKRTSGHGQVVDLGVVDEAMAQPDDRLHQALRPAMKTRYREGLPGAQLWIISTVGSVGESEWFHSWVDAGRAAVDGGTCEQDRICYLEYSAAEDADPGDPDVWRACMPALGVTIDEATVAAEYREALLLPDGLAGFRRQALNQRTTQKSDPPIPLHLWDGCGVPVELVERPLSGLVWAVDVSPEQASASVAVCWRRADGVPHVQLVEHGEGVGWLAGRVSELRDRWGGAWVLDPRGASASQAADWPGLVRSPTECRQSCAQLEAAVREGVFSHYGQPELRTALEGAVKRPSEDGGWYWARRSTVVDISPLVAATLAHGGMVAGLAAGNPELAVW